MVYSGMKYERAVEICKGQELAVAVPLKPFPQISPNPNEKSMIACSAAIRPMIIPGLLAESLSPDLLKVYVGHIPDLTNRCIMRRPNCKQCIVSKAAEKLSSIYEAEVTREEYKNNDLSRFRPEI